MVINTVMRRKDSQVDLQRCVVEKAIEISQAEFSALCNGLLEDKDYISKYKDLMRVDNNGITHCLLVLGSDTEDGILINSEGYNYARYSAYIPNIKQSVTLEQFPALESFNKRMIDVTNSIMNQAITSCEESGDPEYLTVKQLTFLLIIPMKILQTLKFYVQDMCFGFMAVKVKKWI